MNEFIEYILKIEQWAIDRNLIKGSSPQKQFFKLMEEFGELCAAIARKDIEAIKDAIGDCFIVIVILNKQVGNTASDVDIFSFGDVYWDFNEVVSNLSEYINDGGLYPLNVVSDLQACASKYKLDFNECVVHAYNQIKDRKGKMIDGVFVKEEDLPNA